MININHFLDLELTNHNKELILNLLKIGQDSPKEKDELIFNKYSVEIDFLEKIVTIYDDVFPEDGSLELSISDFVMHINNYKREK